eukprot:CAMPEP_0113899602 /NCGR_PEP_ID=MMETSP0780_2-20120614/20134_1 /TAXON_ID=652834 /ORGANISM="Palpitomonas bilix" /LENGTH=88 /DNA_ID=CAMNT_0000891811 /DNA_START=44 /DNA_END=310 /DNA_ORIENTATION=- /assembly_acc=CAM_ASM_000599
MPPKRGKEELQPLSEFGAELTEKLLRCGPMEATDAKFSAEAIGLSSHLLKLFVEEALHRCEEEAEKEGGKLLTGDIFKKIVAQLLLDF